MSGAEVVFRGQAYGCSVRQESIHAGFTRAVLNFRLDERGTDTERGAPLQVEGRGRPLISGSPTSWQRSTRRRAAA
jgi:hypothetical protein